MCLLQITHDTLLQYGSTDLQALLQITGEGGAWSNPVLTALLTGQPTNPEEGWHVVLLSFCPPRSNLLSVVFHSVVV